MFSKFVYVRHTHTHTCNTHTINHYPDSEALLTVLGSSFCNINLSNIPNPLTIINVNSIAQVHTNTHSHTSPFPVPSIATQWHCNCARHSRLWAGLGCESDLYLLRAVKLHLRHTTGNGQFIRVM